MPSCRATSSITSAESHPCSSCAIASAAITAERLCAGGYFVTSRSMRERADSLSNLFSMPIVEADIIANEPRRKRRLRRRQRRIAARDDAEFLRVGVVPDVAVDHRADREIAKRRGAGVDELMRGAACRTADEIALPHGMLFIAEAKHALPFEDEEQLLVDVVIVERKGALAGRDRRHVVAELARADSRSNWRERRVESVAVMQLARRFELVEIHDVALHAWTLTLAAPPLRCPPEGVRFALGTVRRAHRSMLPKTMSCEPMIATTSAIICPRDISSSAERCT